MKKFLLAGVATTLLAGAAAAADLPRRAPPPVFTPVPVFTWTGFYAGLESTYAFTDSERALVTSPNPVLAGGIGTGTRSPVISQRSFDGFANIGGGGGYNYQFTPGSGIVVGVGFNIDWTDIRKNTVVTETSGNVSQVRTGLDYLGTVTGRVGYAFDRFLVYGLGGLAFGNVENQVEFYNAAAGGILAYDGGSTEFHTGYAYGGGAEYAIPQDSFLNYFSVAKYLGFTSTAVTIKAEYLHYDLGSRNVFAANTSPAFTAPGYNIRFKNEGNVVRVGFNYKFGGL